MSKSNSVLTLIKSIQKHLNRKKIISNHYYTDSNHEPRRDQNIVMMKKQYPFIKRKKNTNNPSNSIENQNTMTTKIFMFKCIKGGEV